MSDKSNGPQGTRFHYLPRRIERVRSALDKRQPDLVMVAEEIYKVHNLSAVIRTCEALGVYRIHAVKPHEGEFIVNNDITQGCQKWVDITVHDELGPCLDALKAEGLRLVVTDPELGRPPTEIDFTRPTALVFGNEYEGVSRAVRERADEFLRLRMYGFTKSFNISVAVGMTLYEAMEQRRRAGLLDAPRLRPREYEALEAEWLSRNPKLESDDDD